MFCLSHYFHILLPYFVSVVLCPHVSSMFCLPYTKSASHLHLAAMYSVCHIVPHLTTLFYLSHIISTHQCHVLALSFYAHDAVPYFICLTLCCCLTIIFFLSYFMPASTIIFPVSNIYWRENTLPKYGIHKFCVFGFIYFKTCLTISAS